MLVKGDLSIEECEGVDGTQLDVSNRFSAEIGNVVSPLSFFLGSKCSNLTTVCPELGCFVKCYCIVKIAPTKYVQNLKS